MKKEYEEMVENELDDFYTDKEESEKNFKLLIEFELSDYNYGGTLFNFTENKKDVVIAKEVKKGRRKGKQLF